VHREQCRVAALARACSPPCQCSRRVEKGKAERSPSSLLVALSLSIPFALTRQHNRTEHRCCPSGHFQLPSCLASAAAGSTVASSLVPRRLADHAAAHSCHRSYGHGRELKLCHHFVLLLHSARAQAMSTITSAFIISLAPRRWLAVPPPTARCRRRTTVAAVCLHGRATLGRRGMG
jgi:hypothetical protein